MLAIAALLPLAAACRTDENPDVPTDEVPDPTVEQVMVDTPMTAQVETGAIGAEQAEDNTIQDGLRVVLNPVGVSGAAGQAVLSAAEGGTAATLTLQNASEGAHAGHVHRGTCASLGDPVHELPTLTLDLPAGGRVVEETLIPIPPATLANGQHAIAYHQHGGGPGEHGPAIVCGNVPRAMDL